MEPAKEAGMYLIKAADEILQMLEDHLMQLYVMKGSRYIMHFMAINKRIFPVEKIVDFQVYSYIFKRS